MNTHIETLKQSPDFDLQLDRLTLDILDYQEQEKDVKHLLNDISVRIKEKKQQLQQLPKPTFLKRLFNKVDNTEKNLLKRLETFIRIRE
ncbi:hypothetical protein F6Y02_38750 (plasmid) [Bacillus megaterium]|nr:hypothetical protein [Priestia megaterium]